jgi:hypothetical protein
MMSEQQATPATPETANGAPPHGIDAVDLPEGLLASDLGGFLEEMPLSVAGLTRRDVMFQANSATAVYLADEDQAQPRFGMVVALIVEASADAGAAIAALQETRWGSPDLHDVTAAGDGGADGVAYREFSRSFAPGLFAIPNRPVYFFLWYRANSVYAFMVIGDTPESREALIEATVEAMA